MSCIAALRNEKRSLRSAHARDCRRIGLHFERGTRQLRAVQYLHQAGENANQRSAYQEAISLLTKGVELLKTLPNTPERTQQELPLQIALGRSLAITRGYSASEVEQVYARALELCKQMGETPQLFPMCCGDCGRSIKTLAQSYQTARELGGAVLRASTTCTRPVASAGICPLGSGTNLVFSGASPYPSPKSTGSKAIAYLHPSQQHRSYTFPLISRGCSVFQFTGPCAGISGYPEQAL